MTILRQIITVLFLAFANKFCFGQQSYIGHYLQNKRLPVAKRVLVDSTDKMKFILDSTQTLIIAVDFNNNKMWSTSPHRDNKLESYRTQKPYIIYFQFEMPDKKRGDKWRNKKVIAISYNNSQFGLIDLKSGEFDFHGQD